LSNRLEQLLHQEVQTLFRNEVADPALQEIEVISLQLSLDGSSARIAYAAASERREALLRAQGFLRARLASLLDLKRTPKLSFTYVGAAGGGEHGA
jgi:ribosome-binding factor A